MRSCANHTGIAAQVKMQDKNGDVEDTEKKSGARSLTRYVAGAIVLSVDGE
jgi:hypothetical protein